MRLPRSAIGLIAGLGVLAIGCGAAATDRLSNAPETLEPPPITSDSSLSSSPTPVIESPLTTVEIVRQVRSSVVRIDIDAIDVDEAGEPVTTHGVGTGVIIDPSGLIITNNHVVAGQGLRDIEIIVTLSDSRQVAARIVGADPPTDLAVIQIDAEGLNAARLGDSASLEVGANVVAIGHALGLAGEPSVTRGVVSAKNRAIRLEPYSIGGAIQTDASINPGNSGGPLVDEFGRVIGINTAVIDGTSDIGFAISIDLAKSVVEELLANGKVQRAFLGAILIDVTPEAAANFSLPTRTGAAITVVEPDSPAATAGLEAFDIIIEISGNPVRNTGDLLQILSEYDRGATLSVTYYRDSELRNTIVILKMVAFDSTPADSGL